MYCIATAVVYFAMGGLAMTVVAACLAADIAEPRGVPALKKFMQRLQWFGLAFMLAILGGLFLFSVL